MEKLWGVAGKHKNPAGNIRVHKDKGGGVEGNK